MKPLSLLRNYFILCASDGLDSISTWPHIGTQDLDLVAQSTLFLCPWFWFSSRYVTQVGSAFSGKIFNKHCWEKQCFHYNLQDISLKLLVLTIPSLGTSCVKEVERHKMTLLMPPDPAMPESTLLLDFQLREKINPSSFLESSLTTDHGFLRAWGNSLL